jgi:hypothetical protein
MEDMGLGSIKPPTNSTNFVRRSSRFRSRWCGLFFLDKLMKKAKTTINPLSQSLAGFKKSDSVVQGMNPFLGSPKYGGIK